MSTQQTLPRRLLATFAGDGTKARALRSTAVTILNIVGTNGLRLASNLILTRLLYPEAFGLMALAQVFIYALHTFSDIGINISIIQNKRGDEPEFLNTVWTLQIIRGIALWTIACLAAWPASLIYSEPTLRYLLPAAALTVLIEGFKTTREAQANRHLQLERIMLLGLACQVGGLVATATLAFLLKSVWALVVGAVIASAFRVIVFHLFLPGAPNRIRLEREAAREIIHFGAFIFLSTIASFLINMSDRAVLGAYIDMKMLGIYSIAFLVSAFPGQITNAIARNVLLPLYRLKPPAESESAQYKLFRARRMVSSGSIFFLAVLSFAGVWLIDILFDHRYALAGPMVVLFALRAVPYNAVIGTQDVLLANGDSRRYFFLTATTAALQVGLTFAGAIYYGVVGVIVVPAIVVLLTYPLRARFTARYAAWDPLGELGLMSAGFLVTALGCAHHWPQITRLLQ